jgi:energy-converting hydrogenase B subunit D
VTVLLIVLLTLVAAAGWLTVVTREPVRQAITAGVFGLLLAATFYALQAPDVALSEMVVAGAAIPIMALLAISKIHAQESRHEDGEGQS